MSEANSKFRQKLEERRRKEAEQKAQQEIPKQHAPDLIPESDRSPEDQEMDRVISSIDVVDAYRRWCGKSPVDTGNRRTEGIKVSCPKPNHPDKNPSAWINTEKQVWFCGGCQEGGDAYDIAAFHFGYPVPGYKDGENFHKLRKEMAESYGYTFIRPPGATTDILVPPVGTNQPKSDKADKADTSPAPEPLAASPSEEKPAAEVVDLFEDDENITFPGLDWRSIVPPDTFLDTYMKQTCIDDNPEEYHFWCALIALGFVLGRDVVLDDLDPVYGNLFVCTLGPSGTGKSRSARHLYRLLDRALPYKHSDASNKGVHRVSAPGSAEVLIHNFSNPILDPVNPKVVAFYAPVRGLIEFNELSSLVSRANRLGNATKPTLMQFYDMESNVSTSSMTHGMKQAYEPYASALTTTQPRAIRTLLTRGDADSGFLNRWVFACGPEKQKFAIGGTRVDIEPAVDPLMRIQGWAGSFGSSSIRWSSEAAELFTKFFHTTIAPDKRRDDSGLLVRLDLLMKKLILLFTANQQVKEVPVDAVESAIGMYPYIIECYAILASHIGNSLQNELREEILRHAQRFLETKKTGISRRDLNTRLKRKNYPLDLVAKTLKYMVDLGELELEVQKGGMGRPTVRYKYVG